MWDPTLDRFRIAALEYPVNNDCHGRYEPHDNHCLTSSDRFGEEAQWKCSNAKASEAELEQ